MDTPNPQDNGHGARGSDAGLGSDAGVGSDAGLGSGAGLGDEHPEDALAEVGEMLQVSVALAGTAVSLARKLTGDVTDHTVAVGKEVLDGARAGKHPVELAGVIVDGWFDGLRKVLGVVEEPGEPDVDPTGPGHSGEAGHGPAHGEHRNGHKHAGGSSQRRAIAKVPSTVRSKLAELPGSNGRARSVEEVRSVLHEQGQELLYRSAALDDPYEHPALAMILRELSPDEARIVRFLATTGPQAVVDVLAHNPMTRKQRELLHHFSLIGREAGCIRPAKVPVYLDNLIRLGLVHLRPYRLRGQSNYDLLYAQPEVKELSKPKGAFVRLKTVHKGVELSAFGTEMFQQCLESEGCRMRMPPESL